MKCIFEQKRKIKSALGKTPISLCCAALCLAGMLLTGCGQQKNVDSMAEQVQEQEKEGIQEEFEVLPKIEAYAEEGVQKDSRDEKYDLFLYSLAIPEIPLEDMSPEAAANVHTFFDIEKEEYLYEKENYYREADSIYLDIDPAQIAQQENWAPPVWSYEVHYDVTCSDEKYLSLLKHTYVFSGGAHGMYVFTSTVLDKATGRELILDDFLGENGIGKIYLAEYLIEQFEEDEITEFFWDNYDEVLINSVCGDPVFYIEDEKLVFVFNQYELASYAAGHQYAEIALADLMHLEEIVQNKERAQSYIERMKRPDKINDYLIQIAVDQPVYADLDGDGTEEEILLPADQPKDTDQIRLQINGNTAQFPVAEEVERGYIGLMDMYMEDGKYELACYAYGPSADPTTTFYRYRDGNLYEIGKAEMIMDKAAFDESAVYTLGDGYYHGNKCIYYPLETRWISASWRLDPGTDRVTFCEADYYYFTPSTVYGSDEFPYHLLDSVLIYEQDSRDADYDRVEAGGRIRSFQMTDGENWLYAVIASGDRIREGWIYVEDFRIEAERGRMEEAHMVIENLHQAG